MKKSFLRFALTLLLLSTLNLQLSTVFAQNTTFTYQGRVSSNGTNFTGNGQFKFALVTSTNNSHTATATATTSGGFVTILNVVTGGNGYVSAPAVSITGGGGSGATATANLTGGAVTSYTVNSPGSGYSSPPTVTVAAPPQNLSFATFWSNDGTSVAGSQPTAAVVVAATNGLFTVVLGDATLANMTTIPAALFSAQPSLQLRLWFNDNVNGFGVLSPLQNLTPVPYASFAASASNVLGAVAASQLSGAVPAASLAGSYGSAVTLGNANNAITGTFTGNGAGVTNISLTSIGPTGTFNTATLYFAITNGIFSPVTNTVPNAVAAAVALADVYGSGRLDLILGNYFTNSFTVLTNNGSGGFGSNSTVTVGSNPYEITVADMNGDGKPDVLSANLNDATVSVMTNNGAGRFVLDATLPVGAGPVEVVAADFNLDGRMDLVSGNNGSQTLSVYTNKGGGAFVLSTTVSNFTAIQDVAVADFNNDGKPDLAVANANLASITIYTNKGGGLFGSNATYTVGFFPYKVVATDVNGDGRADLAVACASANYLSILKNNGSGGFTVTTISNAAIQAYSLAAADVRGTGRPDLLVNYVYNDASTAYAAAGLLTNDGAGNFSLASKTLINGYGISTVIGDLNGDGKLDAVAGSVSYSVPATILTSYLGTLSSTGAVTFSSALNNFNGTFNGTFIGNGSGLTSLPSFAALLPGTQTFTGVNSFIGSQSGGYSQPLMLIQNTDASANASPALRVIGGAGAGISPNGVLSVSTAGNGLIAQFGNASSFVADITANGTIDATAFIGNGSGLYALNSANLTGAIPSGLLTSVPTASLTGTLPLATLPGVVETNGGSLKIGANGTTLTALQAGQTIMPSSSTSATNIVITFPTAFSSVPKIIFSIANDPGFANVSDTFAASVANVTTTSFRVNVIRVDTASFWNQQLRINWQAWQ